MSDQEYSYSATATKNPFRYALAVWRFMRSKTDDDIISEVAIIEIGFARSRFGRRLARWEETLSFLQDTIAVDKPMLEKANIAPIVLEELETLPFGTLGQVFSEHCHNRGIDPNLIDVPLEEDSDWLLNHLFQTHDIWHVMTGWANDEVGEVGLAGFYCGQLRSPPFFIFLYSLIMLKQVLRRDQRVDEFIRAFSSGYDTGRRAKPLFGINWADHWETPLSDMREKFSIESSGASEFGQGILAEAA
ncbi:MAG: Coq4 family protein [Xanthomonadales bacterium]|jgi:ubiquinone biosynthesis protein Coq4|nr:Coq4 family protein [Xanthomonadales bacterium]PNV86337.1 MAG: hypothetical protein C0610_07195 [Desulfobacteraceae bacterium]